MTRMSKQGERRNKSPKKRHYMPVKKTGSLKDNLPEGFKKHDNALQQENNHLVYIAKVK